MAVCLVYICYYCTFLFEGILFDNGCNLKSYILAREAREFEKLRVLVDGAHWGGHKKMKKG